MPLQVVTANRLDDGVVVYLAAGGRWSERIVDAHPVESKEQADALMALAEQGVRDRLIVVPYLIEVVIEADGVHPVRYRELIRARGPSVRPDLGKQAEQK
jgi:hypothetical protein